VSKSTNSKDYQKVRQRYAVMPKQFSRLNVIEKHSHCRHQLLFASKGLMQLYINNDILLVPNDRAIFIPANTQHSIKMLSDVFMRTIYIEPSNDKSWELDQGLKVISVNRLIHELINALSEAELDSVYSRKEEIIVELIELELENAVNEPILITLPQHTKLRKICSHILNYPSDNITLTQWGDICGVSERTLSRLFAKEIGLDYRTWRQKVRLMHAVELLAQGKIVKQVAILCGYKSLSAFTTAFHAHLGYLPSAFKN